VGRALQAQRVAVGAVVRVAGQEQAEAGLQRKLPAYVLYRTAWIDDDGTVLFADDLYGHDARQALLIPAGAALPTPPAQQLAASEASSSAPTSP
jgi:murein L,D-transpeptidase YcbB/YkuD